MQGKFKEVTDFADQWRKTIRSAPFVSLAHCVGVIDVVFDLGLCVEGSKQQSVDHKKAVSGIRRSGIVEVSLQHLLCMGKRWCTEERKQVDVSTLERNLKTIVGLFVAVLRGSNTPLVDEDDAAKILATIYEVSTLFHFERDTECPFPTFIFRDPLVLMCNSFPLLSFPDIGARLVESLLPSKTISDKSSCGSGSFLLQILMRGPWDRGFDVVMTFLTKHDPSTFAAKSINADSNLLRAILHQLVRWCIANVEKIKADYVRSPDPTSYVKLMDWCLKAFQLLVVTEEDSIVDFFMQSWKLICMCTMAPCDDEVLLRHDAGTMLFADHAWEGWISMPDVHKLDEELTRTAIRRLIRLAATNALPMKGNAAIQSWVKSFLLEPEIQRAQNIFPGLHGVLENSDPHSTLLRRSLATPQAFTTALLACNIDPSATKIHQVFGFALMLQIDTYCRGSRQPFISLFVDCLQRDSGTSALEMKTKASCLLDAVNCACALFASQGYTYTYNDVFPLECSKCGTHICQEAMMCSACHLATYCSAECQQKHWQLNHKDNCDLLTKFKTWISEQAPKVKQGVFADQICFGCGTVRGPTLHYGGNHGGWPATLASDRTMSRCARCKRASYCSKECQVKHWKSGHKEECTPPMD